MIIPPYVATYATQNPYITANEFNNSPTGIDTAQLLADQGQAVNTQALQNVIKRASGWADRLCKQKLSATIDTRTGRWRVRNDGTISVPLPYFPVVGIVSITAGWTPSTMTQLTSLTDVWPDENGTLVIPVPGAGTNLVYPSYYQYLPDDMYCTVQYINGWFNAQVTATVTAGATSIAVSNTLGLNAGQSLNLYGAGDGETVVVDPSYVATETTGPGTVPLASATVASYDVGDTLTAMPAEIKQAVILLTGMLIKTRGAEALEMQSISNNMSVVEKGEDSPNDDFSIVIDLLEDYRRVA